MREKLIELLFNFRMAETKGEPRSIEKRYAEIADYLINNHLTMLPEDAIILTKAERDALNTYSDKVRRAAATDIFDEVEELLQMAIKTEGHKADLKPNTETHHYAKRLCQTLVADLRKLKGKVQ